MLIYQKKIQIDSPRNCVVTQNQCIHQCSVIASSGCIYKYETPIYQHVYMYEREESHKQFKYIKYRCTSISDDFKPEQISG